MDKQFDDQMARNQTSSTWTYGRWASVMFFMAAAWAAASTIDLIDGSTWVTKPRREPGPYFRKVTYEDDRSGFLLVATLRGLMPVLLFGTFSGAAALGAVGQRIGSRS